MKYYVQESGSSHNSLELHASGPLHAEKMYRESSEFSGNKEYLNIVWHLEHLSEDEFYKHVFYFDENGIIEPQFTPAQKFKRGI